MSLWKLLCCAMLAAVSCVVTSPTGTVHVKRAMMKTSKSSLLTLSLAGLISIPIITAVAMGVQSTE